MGFIKYDLKKRNMHSLSCEINYAPVILCFNTIKYIKFRSLVVK